MAWEDIVYEVANSDMSEEMKVACIAQAIWESGRGTSALAIHHRNYWGIKWRDEMLAIKGVSSRMIKVPSESVSMSFCSFTDDKAAVEGWRQFLKRDPYIGWTLYTGSAPNLLRFLAQKGWCEKAANPDYATDVAGSIASERRMVSATRRGDLSDSVL